ncbi:four helix bundle protein [Ancylomarina sp. DW003]|nr:four helix bundle protein [Ancylomarina sp. DW003]MDE5421901.1 four helix bundle protein [Ancylomarina sp. DW003]
MKSYKDLDVYQESFRLAVEVNRMSLKLPKYELYEVGAQIRRSSQSVKDNIVEGYGRKEYPVEFNRFLVFAYASLLEALSQLEMLKVLYGLKELDNMIEEYKLLGKKLYRFKEYVKNNWRK